MRQLDEQCERCLAKWGQIPQPWGESTHELEAYEEHMRDHVISIEFVVATCDCWVESTLRAAPKFAVKPKNHMPGCPIYHHNDEERHMTAPRSGPAGFGSASAPPEAGYGSGGVSEPGDLPRYATPTGEHPALIAMRERQAEADAQGYMEGDVNHLVQPIIGLMRLRLLHGKPMSADDLDYAIERLDKACKAELAWLALQKAAEAGS
jgi:hypothetical protein